jgi:hypothetical protein
MSACEKVVVETTDRLVVVGGQNHDSVVEHTRTVVIEDETPRLDVIHATNRVVVQGVGQPGPPGPPGPPGGAFFLYTQTIPAATWPINHNLGASRVHVTLFDVSGRVVDSDILEVDANNVTVMFSLPQAGTALISV